MKRTMRMAAILIGLAALGAPARGEPALTIYNQNFAVVRDTLTLDLNEGENEASFSEITAQLEPDSVILRDPTGKRRLLILEQNYRNDPVSQDLLLHHYEGRTIDFLVHLGDGEQEIVEGRIVRSGWGRSGQPLLEIDGQLRFGLPGVPLFPALADDSIMKPTLQWVIAADAAGPVEAELGYVTGGLSWEADYNLVAPEEGDRVDLIGWVTMENQSGRTFEGARIKLMAGDVSKVRAQPVGGIFGDQMRMAMAAEMAQPVTEKSFDEFHLYTIARRTTLRDQQTKQVEFVRATDVLARRLYIYDGAATEMQRYRGWDPTSLRQQADAGTQSNPKVWTMREFENSEDNNLGIPLPKGRVRFYRQDDDGQLEFTGENVMDHTPKNEKVRLYTGNAFDLVGERKRTDYRIDQNDHWLEEAFEIRVRNRKEEPVEVTIVEHLFRWVGWEILEASHEWEKTNSQEIEFKVEVPADGEVVTTYRVRYSW